MQNNNYVWYKHNEDKKEHYFTTEENKRVEELIKRNSIEHKDNINDYYTENSQKEEKKPNYLLIVLGAIFMVECITMLGIVLSAMWYIEYGV